MALRFLRLCNLSDFNAFNDLYCTRSHRNCTWNLTLYFEAVTAIMVGVLGFPVSPYLYNSFDIFYAFMTWLISGSELFFKLDFAQNWNSIPGRGHSHFGSYLRCAARMGEFWRSKNLRMGVKFCPKTCGWVIILIHKTTRLVSTSIILPGNGWCSWNWINPAVI